MKVKLFPIVSYEVETEDGLKLGTFLKKSEWNEMTQLNCGVERMIIESPGEILDIGFFRDLPKLVNVISCTPGLSPQIEREPAARYKMEVQ